MNLDCELLQENLHQALGIILRVTSVKSELPVLGNVLLEASKNKIFFSGTNLEMGTRLLIGGKIAKEGAITVPARVFAEFIATIPAGKVRLHVQDGILVVKSTSSQARFTTIPASEFPPFPKKGESAAVFQLVDLRLLAQQVAFAASTDEGRPVLTGVQFKKSDSKLMVAATDGFRLSVRSLSDIGNGLSQVIIPAKTLQEVAKIAVEKKAESITINLASSTSQLIFSLPDVEVYSRLIEGEFPNYERIIPQGGTTRIKVDRETLLRAVRAAAIFARESANIVKLQTAKNTLVLSANTPQLGEEKTEVEAEVEGEGGEIAFNFRFLLDYLNNIESSEVILEMTTPLSPALFRLKDDEALTHVIMPVRVQG